MPESIDASLIRVAMAGVRLPINPTPAEFRAFLAESIRNTLSHGWLLAMMGDTRRILEGVQSYLPSMPDAELVKLMALVPPS